MKTAEIVQWMKDHVKEHMNGSTCVVDVESLARHAAKELGMVPCTRSVYNAAMQVAVTAEIEGMMSRK